MAYAMPYLLLRFCVGDDRKNVVVTTVAVDSSGHSSPIVLDSSTRPKAEIALPAGIRRLLNVALFRLPGALDNAVTGRRYEL